ncbi:hypothetical protein [Duganella phyllosphaerae]|uniref:Uncharacterized protein n=1 Tax=Duganella phyllosphaerae TaxID=762836 RepID=A0A1E7X7R0_9BURK|nr:hypothetical protein [Duganella phyllosphaerae]OFA09038.1 hypothetical protein DUPY_02800 [Duganella phyllosphaerae]
MTQTVEQAEIALAKAKAEFLSELETFANSGDGSGAQERRREERLQRLRDAEYQCERDLEQAKRNATQA